MSSTTCYRALKSTDDQTIRIDLVASWHRATLLWLTLTLGSGSTACLPRSVPCRLIRPVTTTSYRIVSSYGASFFRDECPLPNAREMTIDSSAFRISAYFTADEDPQVLLGVAPRDDGRYSITGKTFRALEPGTVFEGRATMFTRLSVLPDHVISFQVIDDGGVATSYEIRFDVVRCTCKRYDGP
jgi:hypothetical protein